MIKQEQGQEYRFDYDTDTGVFAILFTNGSADIMDALHTEHFCLFLSLHRASIAKKWVKDPNWHQSYLKMGLYEHLSLSNRTRWLYDSDEGTLAWVMLGYEPVYLQPEDVRGLAMFLEENKESIISHAERMRKRYDLSTEDYPALTPSTVIYQEVSA